MSKPSRRVRSVVLGCVVATVVSYALWNDSGPGLELRQAAMLVAGGLVGFALDAVVGRRARPPR